MQVLNSSLGKARHGVDYPIERWIDNVIHLAEPALALQRGDDRFPTSRLSPLRHRIHHRPVELRQRVQ